MLDGSYLEIDVIHRPPSFMHAAVYCQIAAISHVLYSYSRLCTVDLFWISKLFTSHSPTQEVPLIYFNKMTYFPLQCQIYIYFPFAHVSI